MTTEHEINATMVFSAPQQPEAPSHDELMDEIAELVTKRGNLLAALGDELENGNSEEGIAPAEFGSPTAIALSDIVAEEAVVAGYSEAKARQLETRAAHQMENEQAQQLFDNARDARWSRAKLARFDAESAQREYTDVQIEEREDVQEALANARGQHHAVGETIRGHEDYIKGYAPARDRLKTKYVLPLTGLELSLARARLNDHAPVDLLQIGPTTVDEIKDHPGVASEYSVQADAAKSVSKTLGTLRARIINKATPAPKG